MPLDPKSRKREEISSECWGGESRNESLVGTRFGEEGVDDYNDEGEEEEREEKEDVNDNNTDDEGGDLF